MSIKASDPSGSLPPGQIYHPFSMSWIQALASAADNPVARTIKPKLEMINALSRTQSDIDRKRAAESLWEFAESEGLKDLLCFLPIFESNWVFDIDDVFNYQRRNKDPQAVDCALSFDAWRSAIGLEPIEVALTAEVFSGDWSSLVRSEAVRLQQSFNMSAVPQATTLRLPCTASWDTKCWTVRFDDVSWVKVQYADLPYVSRPSFAQMEERLTWIIAAASDNLVAKKNTRYEFRPALEPWFDCVESLKPLHEMLLRNAGTFSTWVARCWSCIWPVVYREQNVLRERADIDRVRSELKACLDAQPRLCMWMFVFAKLLCQTQISTGLGFCADFRSS